MGGTCALPRKCCWDFKANSLIKKHFQQVHQKRKKNDLNTHVSAQNAVPLLRNEKKKTEKQSSTCSDHTFSHLFFTSSPCRLVKRCCKEEPGCHGDSGNNLAVLLCCGWVRAGVCAPQRPERACACACWSVNGDKTLVPSVGSPLISSSVYPAAIRPPSALLSAVFHLFSSQFWAKFDSSPLKHTIADTNQEIRSGLQRNFCCRVKN